MCVCVCVCARRDSKDGRFHGVVVDVLPWYSARQPDPEAIRHVASRACRPTDDAPAPRDDVHVADTTRIADLSSAATGYGVWVRWCDGRVNVYRYGVRYKYDLQKAWVAPLPTTTTPVDAVLPAPGAANNHAQAMLYTKYFAHADSDGACMSDLRRRVDGFYHSVDYMQVCVRCAKVHVVTVTSW